MDSSVSQSLRLAKHLRNRTRIDPLWISTLDDLFISAAYEKPTEDPAFSGPDRLTYVAFRLARANDVELVEFKEMIDMAIHWAAGAVIYPGAGIDEWIYSPGDLVSLAICGRSAFLWQGDWGKDPIVTDYAPGIPLNVGSPSPEFLAPLAARSLEAVMRRVFQNEPSLKGRVPSIAVTRPQSRTRPEQASEIMLNAYKTDFENAENWDSFQVLIGRFLPSHLARRLLSFEEPMLPEDRFFTLRALISAGGLEPVPEPV